MKIPKFNDFIKESDDEDIDKDAKKYIDSHQDICPRCGEPIDDCTCKDEDYWSTQTYFRVKNTKNIKTKPKQDFSKK